MVDSWPELPRDIADLIGLPKEGRSVEFKGATAWSGVRERAIKTALAMSNLPDGGWMVFGVEEDPPGQWRPVGMPAGLVETFVPDEINDQLRRFAEPPFPVEVLRGTMGGNLFVVIRVPPFEELPTVCKRNGAELREGAIYTRSIHKPETIEVRSQTEMREIIERAVDIGIRRMRGRFPELFQDNAADRERFRRERGAFE